MSERKHHPYGPSKLQNLEACPCWGSIDGDSEKARLGTLQHNVVETGQDNLTLSDDEASAAAQCLDFFEQKKQLWAEAKQRAVEEFMRSATSGDVSKVREAFSDSTPILNIQELSEIYLPIDDIEVEGFVGTTGGYLDKALIDHTGTRAMLFDWKFGQWQVETANNNLQGIAYSLGVFKAYPKVEQVDFYFKQPHINSISHASWTRADVPALYLRVLTVVERAAAARKAGDFSMANPTIPGCLFCANIALCPKVTEMVCTVGKKFHAVEVPEDITPTKVHDPANSAMAMRLASLVSTWAAAFKNLTTDRALRGAAPVPAGYEIVTGRGRRKIVDGGKFMAAALRYLTKEVYDTTVSPQLGKVEDAIKDTAPRGQKDSTVQEFKALLLEVEAVKLGDEYPYLKAKTKDE